MRIAMIVLVALAGCGDGPGTEAGPASMPAPGTARAVLTEFAVAVDQAEVAAGRVSIEAENAGTIPHELVIVRTDLAPEALPIEGAVVAEDEVTVVADSGPIERGSTRPVVDALDPGAYVLICNVAGHYQAGMHAPLMVSG